MMRPIFIATVLACGLSTSPSLATTPSSHPTKSVDARQAHAVRVCENGRCWWSDEHWGYGARRRDRDYDDDRDWRDRDWDDRDDADDR